MNNNTDTAVRKAFEEWRNDRLAFANYVADLNRMFEPLLEAQEYGKIAHMANRAEQLQLIVAESRAALDAALDAAAGIR